MMEVFKVIPMPCLETYAFAQMKIHSFCISLYCENSQFLHFLVFCDIVLQDSREYDRRSSDAHIKPVSTIPKIRSALSFMKKELFEVRHFLFHII